jgi:hypothetical protein
MPEKHEKKETEDKKKKRKPLHGSNVEPAEKPVEGPTGHKTFKV